MTPPGQPVAAPAEPEIDVCMRLSECLTRFSEERHIPRGDLPAETTFAKLRCFGGGPPYVKPKAHVVLYPYPPFRQWMLERMTPKHSTAADAVARRQPA